MNIDYKEQIDWEYVERVVNNFQHTIVNFGYYSEEGGRGKFTETKALKADLRGNYYVYNGNACEYMGLSMFRAVDNYNKLK